MLGKRSLSCWAAVACAAAATLAAGERRDLRPETRAFLETVLSHFQAALAQVEELEEKDSLISSWAHVKAELGDPALAQEYVRLIKQQSIRDFTLEDIANVQADGGGFAAARDTVKGIESPYYRGRALGWVALQQASAGQTNEALTSAAEIEDARALSETLSRMGPVLAHRGEWAAAESALARAAEAARQLEGPADQAWQLLAVAEAQKRAGQEIALQQTLAWARETAGRIEGIDRRERVLASLVAAQARLGLEAEAYVIEGTLESRVAQLRARGALAARHAERGDADAALALIEGLDEPTTKDEKDARAMGLGRIVLALANAGRFAAALEAVRPMPANHWQRAHSLAGIARLQWGRGQEEASARTFQEALEVAQGVPTPGMKAQALRIVAVELARVGESKKALGVASEIEISNERRNAFVGIAGTQARWGQAAAALEWAAKLENPVERASTLLALAGGMIEFDQHGPLHRRRSGGRGPR